MSVSLTVTIAGREEASKFKEKIKEEAMKQGMSISEFVVGCIAEYLRSHADA